jgi:hypothetical protein
MQGATTSVMCQAPCDDHITGRQGQEFFLGGEGIRPSSRFSLPTSGSVHMMASPGSSAMWGFGLVLVILGGSAAPVGGAFIPFNASVGGATLGTGLAVLAGGIALMVGGRTTYSFEGRVTVGGRTTYSFEGRELALRF